jgi:hypothetical protein
MYIFPIIIVKDVGVKKILGGNLINCFEAWLPDKTLPYY